MVTPERASSEAPVEGMAQADAGGRRRGRVLTAVAVAVPAAAAVMLIFAKALAGTQRGDATRVPAWLPWTAWAGVLAALIALVVLVLWEAWRVWEEARGYRLRGLIDGPWLRAVVGALATLLLCVMTLSLVPSW